MHSRIRCRHDLGEDRALVDEVGEATRARLGPELGSGVVAFLGPQRLDAIPQLGEPARRNERGQHEVAQLVELPPGRFGDYQRNTHSR